MCQINQNFILDQLNRHADNNYLLPSTVCAYRKKYNTKLLILKIVKDIKMAMDTENATAVIAINLLVAFNTMNHQILLNIFDQFSGIKGEAW